MCGFSSLNAMMYQFFDGVLKKRGVLINNGNTLCYVYANHSHDCDNMEPRAQIDSISPHTS